jgi:hypothetical protein
MYQRLAWLAASAAALLLGPAGTTVRQPAPLKANNCVIDFRPTLQPGEVLVEISKEESGDEVTFHIELESGASTTPVKIRDQLGNEEELRDDNGFYDLKFAALSIPGGHKLVKRGASDEDYPSKGEYYSTSASFPPFKVDGGSDRTIVVFDLHGLRSEFYIVR